MRRSATLVLPAIAALAAPLSAQTLRLGVHGAYATYHEATSSGVSWRGLGFGGSAELRAGSFLFAGSASKVSLDPDIGTGSIDMLQWDARAALRIGYSFWLESGGGRITVDPEFAAQDIGYVRVGLLSETRFARNADVWARAGYLPVARFSGGGTAPGAVEVGFGMNLGPRRGRAQLRAGYQFQRFDRGVSASDVPIQTSTARLGFGTSF